MSSNEIPALRNAVATVKNYLASVEVGPSPNDLIITAIEDRGDLWLFSWNNGWPLLGLRMFEYPGCSPLAVFKQDGTLIQIPHNYGWVEGAFEEALEETRRLWREKDQTR